MTEIEEIFTKCLPSIPSSAAESFAKGMHAYYDAFNTMRASEMNYEKAPDYHNALHDIMVVKPDDYWIYTPHFKKIMGLSISKIFKTKITRLACANDVEIFHSTVYVDEHRNRFVFFIIASDVDPTMIRLCARFPVSGTKMQEIQMITDKEMSSPDFNASMDAILVQDASAWHDKACY